MKTGLWLALLAGASAPAAGARPSALEETLTGVEAAVVGTVSSAAAQDSAARAQADGSPAAEAEASTDGSPPLAGRAPESADVIPARAAATDEIDLVSETLTVEHRKRRATFGGGVVATRGDLEVRCPTLTALYDQRAKVRQVICEGPVSATQGAKTMTSRTGFFDNASGKLHLEGETTLTEADRRFQGESLDFEMSTSLATLSGAQAVLPGSSKLGPLQPEGDAPFQITADRVTHDFARHRTTFSGNVVATRGDLVMRASRLVTVGADDGRIDRAWTEGGPVRVVQGDRRGTAQRGTFVAGGQRLVLEGEPIVTEGDSSLRGDRVTFFVGQGRVEVSKPRAVFPLKKVQEEEGR